MSDLQISRYDSLDDLRRHAAAWDDLWRRSHTTRPTARAALVAHWIEHFAPQARFCALLVRQGDRLLAGLPLIGQRVGGVWEAGCLPHNAWSPAGDLLLCRDGDASLVMQRLAQGLAELPWQLVWINAVPVESFPWQALRAAVASIDMAHAYRELFEVGVVDVPTDWETYRQNWSQNHRRNMTKARRRLEQLGRVELEIHHSAADGAIEALVRRAFEMEDRGWKGRAGSSVLGTPGMFAFLAEQARLLAADGRLALALLKCNGQPIAFEYGLWGKNTYHALKVGYDERFARCSPGQVLMHLLLERFSHEGVCHQYDCMGPLSDAMTPWLPRRYRLGRLVMAPRSLMGRLLLHTYSVWWPRIGAVLPRRRWPANSAAESGSR